MTASEQNPYEAPHEQQPAPKLQTQAAKMGRIWLRFLLLGIACTVVAFMCVNALDSAKLRKSEEIVFVILTSVCLTAGLLYVLVFGTLWFMQSMLGLEYKPIKYQQPARGILVVGVVWLIHNFRRRRMARREKVANGKSPESMRTEQRHEEA